MLLKSINKLSQTTISDIKPIIALLQKKDSEFWIRAEQGRALTIFHEAAARVPAYKDFLKKNGINARKIKSYKDFQQVPITSKNNYLRNYPLEKLVLDGSLKSPFVFSATSGSTGKPFYFPRSHQLDWEYSIILENFFTNGFTKDAGPTLVIVCFGMGVWIGGMITYKAFETASHRGHAISIITPGINKSEIFNALRDLAPNFKRTILVGYPPFVKDILDEAAANSVDLKCLNLRLLFAAESFTEEFRDYVATKAGITNVYQDTLNIYGSADIGAMAYETPLSILARRSAVKNKNLFRTLFPSIQRLPTLAQYNPLFINFEAVDNEIILTGNSAMPLVRYAIGDCGGVMNFEQVVDHLSRHGVDIFGESKIKRIPAMIAKIPFVYVYERSDFSTTLYGLQIYPGMIKDALVRAIAGKYLTGKFTLITKFSSKNDQYLEINLEIKKDKTLTTGSKAIILKAILKELLRSNSEFRELYRHVGKRAIPKLVFWPTEHPRYFKVGTKQKWVNKT